MTTRPRDEEHSSVTYRFSHQRKGSGMHLQNGPYVSFRLEDCDGYFFLINGRFYLTSFVLELSANSAHGG